jgi:hypothetical protein
MGDPAVPFLDRDQTIESDGAGRPESTIDSKVL